MTLDVHGYPAPVHTCPVNPHSVREAPVDGAWTAPARHLQATSAHDIADIWRLAHTAEIAALRLAMLPGTDDDLALSCAAADLGDAVDALETLDPTLPRTTRWVDLGPAPLDQVTACRSALTGLVLAAITALGRHATDPTQHGETLAMAGTAMPHLASAYRRITGTTGQ